MNVEQSRKTFEHQLSLFSSPLAFHMLSFVTVNNYTKLWCDGPYTHPNVHSSAER